MTADRVLGLLLIGVSVGVWLGVRLAEARDDLRRDVDEIADRRNFEAAMRRHPSAFPKQPIYDWSHVYDEDPEDQP